MAAYPVTSPDDQWISINAATGVAVGTGLLVQNQSSAVAMMQLSATLPTATDFSGRRIVPNEEVQIDSGGAEAWMRCVPTVRAYVQTI